MDFSKIVQKRRACHSFQPNIKIPQKDWEQIFHETSLTPSGYNLQPWEFILIQDHQNIQQISKIAYNQAHVKDASAIVIAIADTHIARNADKITQQWLDANYLTPEKALSFKASITKERPSEKNEKMALRSTTLACMSLIYSAENLGYATCPMMGFRQLEMKKFLKIPDDRSLALMIAIGKANPNHKVLPRLPRKSFQELVHQEKFSEKN
jgi:nitroreductase